MPLSDFAGLWASRLQRINICREYPVYQILTERRKKEVEEKPYLIRFEYKDLSPENEWLSVCWQMANDSVAEFTYIYNEMDVADMFEIYTHRQVEYALKELNTEDNE